mmetsp:Transcript_8572/g.12632  ORF Transcript_8572/g.12632 Transcript_8572/m.12632 type:complete len:83 (+) Transcript_8572:30-278(+)
MQAFKRIRKPLIQFRHGYNKNIQSNQVNTSQSTGSKAPMKKDVEYVELESFLEVPSKYKYNYSLYQEIDEMEVIESGGATQF